MIKKVGIIAGAGDLPQKLIAACQERQLPYHILAYLGQTPEDFVRFEPHTWVGIAQVGKTLRTLQDQGCDTVVMAGYFSRPNFSQLKPDLKGGLLLAKMASKALGDDGLLRILVDFFEQEGFKVVGSEELIGHEVLIKKGILTKEAPLQSEQESISRGLKVAKTLGALDVGQALIVERGLILGVEALEGTDNLIKRCGQMESHRRGEGFLVKVIKPGQEARVDRSVLGLKTLENLAYYGFRGIVAEADQVILLDQDEMVAYADKNILFMVGVEI